MVGKKRESRGRSQRVDPEGCPPMERGIDFHGSRPALVRRERPETPGEGSWRQAASGGSSHSLPPRGTEEL